MSDDAPRIKLHLTDEEVPDSEAAQDYDPAIFAAVCETFGHQPEGCVRGRNLVGRCQVCGYGFLFKDPNAGGTP